MRPIGSQIWVVDQNFKLPIVGNIGTRMTVIRLSSGELMLISPTQWSESLDQDLRSIGKIRYLIAPNSTHHLFLPAYQQHYSEALSAAPLKLQKKRTDLSFQISLVEGTQFPWESEVKFCLVDSDGSMSEAVFFHLPSRTLIVTDLLFHLQHPENWMQKWVWKLNSSYQKLNMTKVGRSFWKNRELLRSKVQEMTNWDFEKIIVAHGEIAMENGKQEFIDSFQWLKS